MSEIGQFEHNGITIKTEEGPTPLGPPGEHVIAWVVTAPGKDASIVLNTPFLVRNMADAALLFKTGSTSGTGYQAALQTLKQTQIPQYFIVVDEGGGTTNENTTSSDDTDGGVGTDQSANTTLDNIIGKVDSTGKRTGIEAIVECAQTPTLIAVPGYSHHKEVLNKLVSIAKRLRCRVIADAPDEDPIHYTTQFDVSDPGYDRVYLVAPKPYLSSNSDEHADVYPSTIATGTVASVSPWISPGNQSVPIQGVSRVVEYNILDKNTEGHQFNQHGVSYFAKTNMGGFRLIGNRSMSGKFISFVGLEDAIARKLEWVSQQVMSQQLTKRFMEQEIRKINLFLQDLVAAEVIPGGEVYLHPTLNTSERYKNGSWYIVIDYGRYSPNEHMVFHINASDKHIDDLMEEVL